MAHVPELDVSSCGETADEARRNIKDAVRGFLETAEEMGTLSDILKEAGYRQDGDGWIGLFQCSSSRISCAQPA